MYPVSEAFLQAVQTSAFLFLGSYTLYGEFFDRKDGYWYGFSNEGNSSGNAKMVWVKTSKTDYFDEEFKAAFEVRPVYLMNSKNKIYILAFGIKGQQFIAQVRQKCGIL